MKDGVVLGGGVRIGGLVFVFGFFRFRGVVVVGFIRSRSVYLIFIERILKIVGVFERGEGFCLRSYGFIGMESGRSRVFFSCG